MRKKLQKCTILIENARGYDLPCFCCRIFITKVISILLRTIDMDDPKSQFEKFILDVAMPTCCRFGKAFRIETTVIDSIL